MSRRVRIFDDELMAKRVYSQLQQASKSPFNYKNKTENKNSKNSNEVVVKITGNSKNMRAVEKHIDYITRKDTLEIMIDENESFKGKDEIKEFKEILQNEGSKIPNQSEIKDKEKRELMHMVFSMRNKKDISKDKLLKAAMQTVKEKYPNNLSAFVYHSDTDNPHIHIALKVKDHQGKRIDIRKKDLAELRKNFAKELNKLGVEATATIKRNYDERKSKNHFYQVVEYGAAKYEFSKDKDAQDSYFVKYKTKQGESIIWSKDLEKVVLDNNVKIGEFVRFKIIDRVPITIKAKKKVNGKTIVYEKEAHKSVWDCSVQGREKDLRNPPPKGKVKFGIQEIKNGIAEFKRSRAAKSQVKDKSLKKGKGRDDIER